MTTYNFPIYDCSKTVRAFRIKKIQPDTRRGMLLIPDHPTLPFLWVTEEWVRIHQPEGDHENDQHEVIRRGGYYVVDARGYATYTPAAAFEAEHTLVSDATPIVSDDPTDVMRRELDDLKTRMNSLLQHLENGKTEKVLKDTVPAVHLNNDGDDDAA